MSKVTLIGESNPHSYTPYHALYPSPEGCSGHRLCCLILGMRPLDYLEVFNRVNLCPPQLPHPSGLCRIWSRADSIGRARRAISVLAPEIAHLIGGSDEKDTYAIH